MEKELNMKSALFVFLIVLFLFTPVLSQEAGEIAIIVAKDESVESITLEEVRDIFLKNDASESYVARDMNEGSPEREAFVKKVLGMTQSQMRQHWGAKMNEGYEEWPRKRSGKSMVSFVSRGGRIGYVDAKLLPTFPKAEKVKVVLVVK
jgi:ABC-type protease/lipase transport system fused ATPase/permease subunit